MCTTVSEMLSAARALVSALDVSRLRADDAVSLVEQLGELERLVAAGRTLAAGRVAATRAWRGRGVASACAFVAQRTGVTFKQAAATLQTAQLVGRLPQMRDAPVAGRLSGAQAAEITTAAAADPSAVPALLTLAEQESVETLREKCRDVASAAVGDRHATERIRRSRYLRHWSATDGADRIIPAAIRTALEHRDPTCVVPGCNRRRDLEIDHIVPLAHGGPTSLANLARLCRWHHAQKTHHGWRLTGRPGNWTWSRHPHQEHPRRE
jgi:5-methylcytosine-specific restriction endonuclease McrA